MHWWLIANFFKVWINQGDIILLSLRDYQDEKGDVILKYTADEARNLKAYGELPESAKINETDTFVCYTCIKSNIDKETNRYIRVTRATTNGLNSASKARMTARLISMKFRRLKVKGPVFLVAVVGVRVGMRKRGRWMLYH